MCVQRAQEYLQGGAIKGFKQFLDLIESCPWLEHSGNFLQIAYHLLDRRSGVYVVDQEPLVNSGQSPLDFPGPTPSPSGCNPLGFQ